MPATIVRTTRNRDLLEEWSLVLSAADIQHHKSNHAGKFALLVDAANAEVAVATLSDYDRERRLRRPRAWPSAERSTNVAWIAASAILLGQMWLGPADASQAAVARGANRAVALLSGDWWRPLTALTLHADALHAMSNAASTLLFLSPLCRILGGGSAFALTLAGGALGNLANAVMRGAPYSGIGASTAVFASVGLLAALRLDPAQREPLWRRLRPIGAAVAILAMLGASPQTDVPAHLLGLAAGAALGVVFTRAVGRPLPRSADLALGAAGVVAVIVAWAAALRAP